MIHFRKYRLPFKTPFATAAGSFLFRDGIIIDGDLNGIQFTGEASPLPGFSVESLNDAWHFLNSHKKALENLFNLETSLTEFDKQCMKLQAPPSVRFGLSSAMANYLSKQAGLTLSRFLEPSSKLKVPINVAIGIKPMDLLIKEALDYRELGFQTFKVKVGQNVDDEYAVIKKLGKAMPGCHLRIDANGNWETDEAVNNLNRLASDCNIEYCEQPVPANDLKGMAFVKRNSPIPIAADESIRSISDIREIINLRAADVLILKPMLIGTITEFREIAELADSHNIGIVVTTSLESGIGRRATAHLAASQHAQPYAHGLATGNLLESDFADDRDLIKDGWYHLT